MDIIPFTFVPVEESGRIIRKFGRDADIQKRLKIIDDSYAFLNAIRLMILLITGKWVILTSLHFVSSVYDSE